MRQEFETVRPVVTLYGHGGDPIVLESGRGVIEFGARPESEALVQVQTSKSIGAASGTWSFTAKVPPSMNGLFERIVDDDWADLVIRRHDLPVHVMRGLVDEVRRSDQVGGGGATVTSWTVSGRDYGKVWEQTPVWFSTYCRENVHGHFAAKVFRARRPDREQSNVVGDALVLGTPQAAVRGYLFGFLEELGGIGRESWNPPSGMPGIVQNSLVKSVWLDSRGFTNTPPRVGIDPSFIMAGGTLWDLAKEWSDPAFTELFVDLAHIDWLNGGSRAAVDLPQPPEDSVMVVTYRDIPFVAVDPLAPGSKGLDSPWFRLPLFEVSRQMVRQRNVGRSGLDRFNAFFASSQYGTEGVGAGVIDLYEPLWDPASIQRHGLRRYDIATRYRAADADELVLSKAQRRLVKDWHCLNPYFLNGTITLGRALPELRVGSRLRVLADGVAEQETFYVESVSHSWQFGTSATTDVGVTRGWVGSDEALVQAVRTVGDRYIVAERARPEE